MEAANKLQRITSDLYAVPSDRTRGHGHNLGHRRFPLNIRRLLLGGWPSPGAGCPGRLRTLHPWRCSEAVWTRSWATGCRWPCLSTGWDKMSSRDNFAPQPFCASFAMYYNHFLLSVSLEFMYLKYLVVLPLLLWLSDFRTSQSGLLKYPNFFFFFCSWTSFWTNLVSQQAGHRYPFISHTLHHRGQ